MSIQVTAYALSELSEATQRKIYDRWEFDTEIFTDYYTDFLTMCGFYKPVLHYNISFSQSDYSCFSCKSFNYEKGFLAKVKSEFGNMELHDFAQRLYVIYAKTFYRMHGKVITRGRYERSRVDFSSYDFDFIEDELNSWLNDYSKYLLCELQNELLYLTSFEAFKEECKSNNYRFTETGILI